MEDCPVVVEARNIVKVYPDGVKALDGVSISFNSGEVHAVLGENGAGKTTLMRIIYGEIRPTRGQLLVCGRPARFHGTIDAIRSGIAMVYQHPRMVPTLTVWDNMRLYFHSAGVEESEAVERLKEASNITGFQVPLDELAGNLPLGTLQRAEILRSIAAGARMLILDEPTTNLTPSEVEGLFRALRRLRDLGIAVAYITHRLREVEEIADTVTVLRRGRVAASRLDPRRTGAAELARLMVGELPKPPAREPPRPGRILLEMRRVKARGRVEVYVEELTVREGEIVGIAGVEGNGQDEIVALALGLLEPEEGEVRLAGTPPRKPIDYYRAGGAYVPGDRGKALLHGFSVAENIAFLLYADKGPALLTPSRLLEDYRRIAAEYRVRAESPWALVDSLSGGNQQKLLVGTQLAKEPRLLIAVNPTRGLDVATTAYVRSLIYRISRSGAGVLLVSSDLDEILELSDRIIVVSKGRVTGMLRPEEATPERLGVLMGGG